MSKVRTTCAMMTCSAAVLVGGCHSAATRIYSLDPTAPTTQVKAYQAPPLRVDTLSVPANWDRIEILETSGLGKLTISDFDHWAAPLPQIARQALSDDLDQRLPPGSVIYPRLPKPAAALGVKVDILEFSVAGSQGSMQASWLIVPGAGSQGAKRGVALFHSATMSAEPAAVAHAWSELIGQLADRIAADAASFSIPQPVAGDQR